MGGNLLIIMILTAIASMALAGASSNSTTNTPLPKARIPDNFREVRPLNLCGANEGAGPRAEHTIYRGARPGLAGLEYLNDLNVQTVVNLEGIQTEKEEQNDLDRIENDPEQSSEHTNPIHEKPHPMSTGLGVNHLSNGKPDTESIVRAVAELRIAGQFPLYVHCHYGDDRTGMVVALHRVFDECWTPAQAEKEWKSIAGWWHNWRNFPKHAYFRKVTKNPRLSQQFKENLEALVPTSTLTAAEMTPSH